MRWRNIELFVVCFFLVTTIAEFVRIAFAVRLLGMNIMHPRLWQYFVLFVILISDSKVYFSKSMRIMYVWTFIYVMMGLAGHYMPDRYQMLGTSPIRLLPTGWAVVVVLVEHYLKPEKINDLRIVIKVTWIAYIVACLTSVYVIIRFPGAVRGTEEAFFREDMGIYRGLGMGGYGFFSAIPFLIPVVMYYFKHSNLIKLRSSFPVLVVIALFMYVSYSAQIVAPFIVSVFILIVSSLGRRRMRASIATLVLMFIMVAVIPSEIIGNGLVSLSESIANKNMSTKIHDMGVSYITGVDIVEADESSGNAVEHRASRVMLNMNQFMSSPLIGAGVPGDTHLFWLNLLAQYGLMGAFPVLWLFLVQFRIIKRFDEEYKFYYLVSVIAFVVMLSIKAIGGYHYMLSMMLMVPGSYYLAHEHKQPSSEVVPVARVDGYTAVAAS